MVARLLQGSLVPQPISWELGVGRGNLTTTNPTSMNHRKASDDVRNSVSPEGSLKDSIPDVYYHRRVKYLMRFVCLNAGKDLVLSIIQFVILLNLHHVLEPF